MRGVEKTWKSKFLLKARTADGAEQLTIVEIY